MKNQNNQMGQKINSVIFLICIFLAPVMFFVTPKNSVSQNEKRKLSTLPIFTINKWISGTYTDSVEAYISDNFILRNKLLTWAEWSNSLKGMVDDDVVFISPQKIQSLPGRITLPTDQPRRIKLTKCACLLPN